MSRPKFEVPVELRNLAERTVEQAEKALDMSFQAANRSMASFTNPRAEIIQRLLAHRTNMRFAFGAARKLAQAIRLPGQTLI
jgi:hypothetical protein